MSIIITIVQPEFKDLENFNFLEDYHDTKQWLEGFTHYDAKNALTQLEIKYKQWRKGNEKNYSFLDRSATSN